MPACKDCAFYVPHVENDQPKDYGHCRRYPPQWLSQGDASDISVDCAFSAVDDDEWCGEYAAKKT